ncbi:MAG: DUF3368 domain-containing protein [Moorellaceae bacterium]
MVVSDATVLIGLSRIGFLWLLKRLWGTVAIPEAVYQEVMTGSPGSEEVAKAVAAGWLRVEKVKDWKMVALLQAGLRGRGECECIVLAQEIGAKAVLTDDKKARKAVEASSIAAVGTLGLLVQAAKEGILKKEEALAVVENLTRTDFRLSRAVVGKAVELIRES